MSSKREDSVAEEAPALPSGSRAARSTWRAVRGVIALAWKTTPGLTALLLLMTLIGGVAPALAAYVARIVVDAVVAAASGVEEARTTALWAVGAEAVLVSAVLTSQRGLAFCQALLRARLAHAVNNMILEKAISLGLDEFEDPYVHDRLEEARRESTTRPLSLVLRSLNLARQLIALTGYLGLLIQLSIWAIPILLAAGLPSFLVEARFSGEAFRFFRSKSPENRERRYLETLLTREEFAKEVHFFGLGPLFLGRYNENFKALYRADRSLTQRRHALGLGLSLLGIGAFFGAYLWIVLQTIEGLLTLGQMTMYLVVFRQGQSSLTSGLTALGGVYEDALYFNNLREFLGLAVDGIGGVAIEGPSPEAGLVVEDLSFTYPGASTPALSEISFALKPGKTLAVVGYNGSGKSTLVKLLTRRYRSISGGRIALDGLSLEEWGEESLRTRISVIFQDFNRYKFSAGENIGAGDASHFSDAERWRIAAERGLIDPLIDSLPDDYDCRLGKAFRGAHELSGGQWQRVAFARSLMNPKAQLLIFDEPTSAADPRRQAELDTRLGEILDQRMGIIISHRMATARIADQIIVLDKGRIREQGTHESLMSEQGIYAELFESQASSYR